MMSVIYQAMTCLIFVAEVGRIKKGLMAVRCQTNLYSGVLYIKKTVRQHFIFHVTTLET